MFFFFPRFQALIRDWKGVDWQKSLCNLNKVNKEWNGWAIVSFKSRADRDDFLKNESLHHVRAPNSRAEKLKVSPWVQKQQQHNTSRPPSSKTSLPLYKSAIAGFTPEEFDRNCTDASIHSFKGRILSYVTDSTGLGHNGLIEIRLQQPGCEDKSERVLFHSDSFWSCSTHKNCFGDIDCATRCGTDNYLPKRLPVGSDVTFKARKIPAGLAGVYRYQAKSVWQGDNDQPKYVTPPSSQKLDEYLEDFLQESARGPGRYPTAKSSPPTRVELSHPLSTYVTAQIKAQPHTFSGNGDQEVKVSSRQKPLTGGLKQLNSNLEQSISKKTTKKLLPSNFAQAVSAGPTATATGPEPVADILLEKGSVESFPSSTEVVVSIPQYGKFTLNLGHFDNSSGRDLRSDISQSTPLLVALNRVKQTGKKTTYVPVKAFAEKTKGQAAATSAVLSSFITTTANRYKSAEKNAPDTWEDLADGHQEQANYLAGDSSFHSKGENDINLEDLDAYYDSCNFDYIAEYFAQELPRLLPKVKLDKMDYDQLANEIMLSGEEAVEVAILQKFFDRFPEVDPTRRDMFIEEFLRYKKSSLSSPFPPSNDNSIADVVPLTREQQETVKNFLDWVSCNVKGEMQQERLALYSSLLTLNPEVARLWLSIIQLEGDENKFFSFLCKNNPTEKLGQELEAWFNEAKFNIKTEMNFSLFQTWLETDTNFFRVEIGRKVKSKERGPPAVVKDSTTGTFNGLTLTTLEHEFVQHQERATETSVFILRILVFLRKGKISWEQLVQMQAQHLQTSGQARRKLFISSLQELLFSTCDQKVLDETNAAIQNNKYIRTREHTPTSHKWLDRFVPVVSASICSFLLSGSEPQLWQSPGRRSSNTSQHASGRDTQQINGEKEVLRQATKSNSSEERENCFHREDYDSFVQFLRTTLSLNSPSEKILMALQDRDVAWQKLARLHASCHAAGFLPWSLEISKLQLNPPIPVSVAQISQLLWNYFENSPAANDVAASGVHKKEINLEKDLLYKEYLPSHGWDQYETQEIQDAIQQVSERPDSELIDKLRVGVGVVFKTMHTSWRIGKITEDFLDKMAALCCQIWSYHKISSWYLKEAIKDVYKKAKFGLEIIQPMKTMLINWADTLDSSSPLPDSILDIFTILRITLAGFDMNIQRDMELNGLRKSIHQKIFSNLVARSSMYNVDGVVVDTVGEAHVIIQTRFCKVVAHIGTVFAPCQKSPGQQPAGSLPLHHWTICEPDHADKESCLSLGLQVCLHSFQVLSDCFSSHMALLVWVPGSDSTRNGCDQWDPPETGVLLPLSRPFVTIAEKFARGHFRDNIPAADMRTEKAAEEVDRNTQLYLTNCFDWMINRIEGELRNSWPTDQDSMRQLFVLHRLGALSSEEYKSQMMRTLEPYIPEPQFFHRYEYLVAIEAQMEDDQEANQMISFYKKCETKNGPDEAVNQLCLKFKIPDSVLGACWQDEDKASETDSWEQQRQSDSDEPAGSLNAGREKTKVSYFT